MQLRLKKISLLFIVLIGVCNLLQAQAKFTAKVSSPTIGKDETVELKLLVENAASVQQITPPSLNDFFVLSGPNQESGMESINGNTKQYIGITFILKPKAKGAFVIAPASAKADGKILHSNAVKIKVSNTAQGISQQSAASPFSGLMGFDEPVAETSFNDFILKKGENLYDKIKKNIFIKVVADKKTCFVGEPIVASYKLYTRLKSESNITKNPSFNDFSVIDLLPPGNNSYNVEKLDGRSYNVYTLRKAQLYPLQSGPLGLESAEVENNVHFVKEEYLNRNRGGAGDVFGDLMSPSIPREAMLDEKITLQSKQELIIVKPLPEANKPASFAGAVGNFTIASSVEKNSFTTDDAGKLMVTISGEGNLTMVNAPEIKWPDGLEAFEPKAEEELNKLSVPVSGSKTFTVPFSVLKEGIYTLPAIEFSFFDLASGKYKILTTQELQVTVAKGIGTRVSPVIAADNKSSKEKFFDTIFANRWMIIAPVALLIFIGLFVWLSRENKKEEDAGIEVINEAAKKAAANEQAENEIVLATKNPFAGAEEKLIQQDSKGFYETINKELKLFLSKELQLQPEAIQKKNIEEAMDKKGVPLMTGLQIQSLIDEIEWQLYTPYSDENKMLEIYEKATGLLHSFKARAV